MVRQENGGLLNLPSVKKENTDGKAEVINVPAMHKIIINDT